MSTTPSTDTDPWDRPLDDGRKAISARHKERAALSNAIPDDWDEETSSSGEEDNQQIIWDNANKQVPMPQLVVTSPRTGSISPGVVVPPASAFQSPIRILKRSTAPAPTQQKMKKKGGDASDSSSSSSPASASTSAGAGAGAGGTFAERSARYNAARERIFAAAAGTATTEAGAGVGIGSTGEGVTGGAIIRNPKGPAGESAQGPNGQGREGSQGFGIRTGKRGSSGQPNEEPGR